MAEKKNQVAKATATDKTNAGNAERYRMRKQYAEEVVPALIKRFGYKNINEVPRLEKIVLNMGLGDCKDNSKSLQLAVEELKMIAGQKPVITTAKKSVANFKVREGMNVGAKLPFAATECTTSSISSFPSRSPESATSAESLRSLLTEEATTQSA